MSLVMMELGVTGPNATDNVSRLELGMGFCCGIIKDLIAHVDPWHLYYTERYTARQVIDILINYQYVPLKELKMDQLKKLMSVTVPSCVFSMFQMISI